jgi:hypothetical protein
MLLHAHVGEIDAVAKLRHGESLTPLDLGKNQVLLAFSQFAQKLAFHNALATFAFEPFLLCPEALLNRESKDQSETAQDFSALGRKLLKLRGFFGIASFHSA